MVMSQLCASTFILLIDMLLLVHTEVLLYPFDELNINNLYIITRTPLMS